MGVRCKVHHRVSYISEGTTVISISRTILEACPYHIIVLYIYCRACSVIPKVCGHIQYTPNFMHTAHVLLCLAVVSYQSMLPLSLSGTDVSIRLIITFHTLMSMPLLIHAVISCRVQSLVKQTVGMRCVKIEISYLHDLDGSAYKISVKQSSRIWENRNNQRDPHY